MAGRRLPPHLTANIPRLVSSYFLERGSPADPLAPVSFGTSGHRGSASKRSFNEDHILAITQAICEYRRDAGIEGPLFLGMDSHALSEAAHATALEVLAANGVNVMVAEGLAYTATPLVSRAILDHNAEGRGGPADGVVITPSHNPPEDGGFKYNPPSGGPADSDVTGAIQRRANQILEGGLRDVRRISHRQALAAETTRRFDYVTPYVEALASVLRMNEIASSGLRIGVDPMGGASLPCWEPIAERFGISLEIVNPLVDPTFSFMPADHDGRIRMDCSSPFAMSGLIDLRERFDIAFGNDPDADRHGIVTRGAGLLNPNHYLAVAAWYLFRHRPEWGENRAIGKTLVSSAMIDRVGEALGVRVIEVPVGFKWFVDGLLRGTMAFAGEESAGASFLRSDGSVWTTDKDGILLDLLAAEITAVTGRDPAEHYRELEERFGSPTYTRVDAPATPDQKALLAALSPDAVRADQLAGDPIRARLTRAPGNDAPIGGLKVVSEGGWFAARPSGTEDVYKLYAESFRGPEHLEQILDEAREIVARALGEGA